MNMQASEVSVHPVVAAVADAGVAVSGVRGSALFGLSDADLAAAIGDCERLRSVTFDVFLGLVAEADERDLARREGASSLPVWLREKFRIRPGDARRVVDLANRSRPVEAPVDFASDVTGPPTGRELVATREALAEGAISPEHVAVVGKVMEKLPASVPAEQAGQAERDMAGFCRQYDPATVAKLGDYLLQIIRGDHLDDEDADRSRRRSLRLDEPTGGVFGTLTAEGMALLRTALDPLAAPVPGEDGGADTRTPGQRLADALVELARRAIAANGYENNHGISHRVMLTIGLDTLTHPHTCHHHDENHHHHDHDHDHSDSVHEHDENHGHGHGEGENGDGNPAKPAAHTEADTAADAGAEQYRCPVGAAAEAARAVGVAPRPGELAWGGFISPAAVRRLACFAGIQRIVIDPMGAVLDVGREYRTVTPAQFAALIARDGGCAFPGCTRPPAWCIAHHVKHWADGGPTDLDNLVLLCTFHHSVVHHRGWDVAIDTDRLPTFYPPPWVDSDRAPRRNNRPRLKPAHFTTIRPPPR